MDLQTLGALAVAGAIALNQISGIDSNVAAWMATPTAANMRTAMGSDRTGTGQMVFADTPTLVTPILGAAKATSIDYSAGATTAGTVRLPAASPRAIVAGTYTLLASTSDGQAFFGSDSSFANQATVNRIYASSFVYLGIGGSNYLNIGGLQNRNFVPVTIEKASIAGASADGLTLDNTTPSSGTTTAQFSTRIRQRGHAWNSTSGLDETHDWAREVRPATAAGATTSSLVFARSLNGGAYSDIFTLLSNGNLRIGNNRSFVFRRADDLGDLNVFSTDSSNNLSFGAISGPNLNVMSGGTVSFWRGGGVMMDYDGTKIRHLIPVWMPTTGTPPANPSAGSVVIWFDGTNLKAKNSAGAAVTWA